MAETIAQVAARDFFKGYTPPLDTTTFSGWEVEGFMLELGYEWSGSEWRPQAPTGREPFVEQLVRVVTMSRDMELSDPRSEGLKWQTVNGWVHPFRGKGLAITHCMNPALSNLDYTVTHMRSGRSMGGDVGMKWQTAINVFYALDDLGIDYTQITFQLEPYRKLMAAAALKAYQESQP